MEIFRGYKICFMNTQSTPKNNADRIKRTNLKCIEEIYVFVFILIIDLVGIAVSTKGFLALVLSLR